MSVSVVMPQLGESVTEGTVTRWLKKEGERVEADEPLLEVSTDKVDTEIPSPASGVLRGIAVDEDETVAVGAQLAVIEDNADAGSGSGDGSGGSAPAAQDSVNGSGSGSEPAQPAAPAQAQSSAPAGSQEQAPPENAQSEPAPDSQNAQPNYAPPPQQAQSAPPSPPPAQTQAPAYAPPPAYGQAPPYPNDQNAQDAGEAVGLDGDVAIGALAELRLELLDLSALAANHDARTRGANDQAQLVAWTLDFNRAHARSLELFLQLLAEVHIFNQQLVVVALDEPA